jgi:hypothetical protein
MLKKPDVWLGPPGWQIVESTSSQRGAHDGGGHGVPFVEQDMFAWEVQPTKKSAASDKARCCICVAVVNRRVQ